jgi:hypothetical protein
MLHTSLFLVAPNSHIGGRVTSPHVLENFIHLFLQMNVYQPKSIIRTHLRLANFDDATSKKANTLKKLSAIIHTSMIDVA